jgi:hypothetical protein
MDIAALKEALGDEKFTELETFVNDLQGQRDQARTESISGRKTLKENLQKLEQQQAALLDRLGIDSVDDIDSLPDVKGAADAAKQYEAKLKRMERELAEEREGKQAIEGRFKESQKSAYLSKALGEHEWLARDVVESFITPHLEWEGDELLFKTSEGKLTSVKDGVAGLAKARPELLKPSGAGGAGVRSSTARGQAGKTMTRAEFDAASHSERAEFAKSGGKVVNEAA